MNVELQNIVVVPPLEPIYKSEDEPLPDFNTFPSSYKLNSEKEKKAMIYAENFSRQYAQLYGDRKSLLLCPINECGIAKLVPTTIKATNLPYKELYDWSGCADFVSDYLDMVTLDPVHCSPKRLLSPATILKRQRGNSFEYSTLLVSLLIGAGYDAYVVSGYATREVCLMDETREVCELLKPPRLVEKREERSPMKRYTVKPIKDLTSKYEQRMAKRKENEQVEKVRKELEDAELADIDKHKPEVDKLYGLRVHSWVLILAGKRNVEENFFIETFTGLSKSTANSEYLGIESIWNNKNYWVNMQNCKQGLDCVNYDLEDCSKWEYMFVKNNINQLKLPDAEDEYNEEIEEPDETEIERHLDVPKSWVEPLELSLRDFQTRCPNGKKTKLYKRVKLEKFAPYFMKEGDGIVCRISSFSDRERINLLESQEFYEHRADKLLSRFRDCQTNIVTEMFGPGRPRHIKKHIYEAINPGPENNRTIIFAHDARVDGLEKRVETPTEMTEYFKGRDDFLHMRCVLFDTRTKEFGPASEGQNPRKILKIVDNYNRNRDVDADKDIKTLTFNCMELKISLIYHTRDDKITSSTREFLKPETWDDKTAPLIFKESEMHSTFQVDPHNKKPKQVELYQLLESLIRREEKVKEAVRNSEKEVKDILDRRREEEYNINLEVSVYDVERNDKAKKLREELERQAAEEKLRQEEIEVDYLAPFISHIENMNDISKDQALKLYDECLRDLKQRLIDKANLIQARFEKETSELQSKQQWYQHNQIQMHKDDVNSYLAYCSEAMFKIHILQLRLDRHKELAPMKYMELQQKLKNDLRLKEFLKGQV